METTHDTTTVANGTSARMERWKQQLLDLSLRNHLLNLRDGLQAVQFQGMSLHEAEDRRQSGTTFVLDSLENRLGPEDFQATGKLPSAERQKIYTEAIDKAKKAATLYSERPAKELSRKLLELLRKGRLDQEEGDVHTIFAAFGALAWKPKGDKLRRYAPLVLEPVTLARKSVQAGFTITRYDDDTIFNQTLVELLKRDFQVKLPQWEELPADEHGVNLKEVFDQVRQAVAGLPECEVIETLYVARLSFSKFLMWNDLNNRSTELEKQPLVHHLVQGLSGVYDDQIEVFPPEEVESHAELDKLCCPLAADASQLTAILYSALGKTFVLHGPPGTGKSQSIANLICHNLTLGRRVLFVSEKKAALEVVQNRLNKLGMKPFCLELHSNKAGKSEVLAQFREALDLATAPEPQNWQTLVKDLSAQRDALNGYIRLLHHRYPNGISAFQCLAETLEPGPEAQIAWECDNLLAQTAEERAQLDEALKTAQDGFAAVTPELCHKLRLFATKLDWTKLDNSRLQTTILHTQECADQLQDALQGFDLSLGYEQAASDQRKLAIRTTLASCLPRLSALPAGLLCNEAANQRDALRATLDHAKRYCELRSKLSAWLPNQLSAVPVAATQQTLKANNAKFFVARFFANRSLGKALMRYCQPVAPRPSADDLARDLPLIQEFQTLNSQHANGFRHLGELLGNPGWLDSTPNWNTLEKQLEDASQIVGALIELYGPQDDTQFSSLSECLPEALPRANAFIDAMSVFNQSLQELQRTSAMETLPTFSTSLEEFAVCLADATETLASLRAYRVWRQSRESADADGLTPFLDALEQGLFPPAELLAVFRRKLEAVMLKQILSAEPTLADFIGTRHEHRIEQFCKLDADYMALSAKLAVARISARLPARRGSECPAGTALGFLKRECEKKSRIKPVRTILQNVAPILGSLKPCFLMSPLSVAQYLPPDMNAFDLVVFDEASQIPTADAIGAIARGKQFICVGDQKQMPPTQFFQKTNTDTIEEDDEAVEELDSILDECLTAGVHSCHLNWHYRSRHESLIAFSNQHYYDNKLNTFPAAKNSPLLGVHFQFVPDAILDRRTRTNSAEADAIVAYVAQMLADPAQAKRSIGIVTFNIAQCELIQDRFEQFRTDHPQFEEYFSDALPEPFFVKNLENVQGDERDVILFSVGYAPDADGKLYMNFGPLNRVGGERRLNVAITRAKHRVVVFSSIHATQIDLSRTSAKGASDLREFLAYAERGAAATAPKLAQDQAADTLQEIIAKFLASKGYETDRNVGCSSFRIDLAVKHPEKPGEYLLGILCDGQRSARDYTCRDRESTRTGVLKGLGWHLAHAWSTEWRLDRPAAEQALLDALEQAINPSSSNSSSSSGQSSKPSQPSPANQPSQPSQPTPAPCTLYPAPSPLKTKCPLEEFGVSTRCHTELVRQVKEVIAAEGPVTHALLARRLRSAWKIARNTPKVQDAIQSAIEVAKPCTTTDASGNSVYWPEGINPQEYRDFRVPATPEERRAFDEIPDVEIHNAAQSILRDFPDATEDIVVRETARLFGFPSCTPALRKRFDLVAENTIHN
ncbi:MAG: DUF3320 domain-containing protein [Victivallales bacterium]|nr:DUF3320 domain-containing protein [Victivallales bacterium]